MIRDPAHRMSERVVRRRIRVVMAAVLGLAALVAEASGPSGPESEVLRAEDRWRIAQKANDVSAFMALLSPDVTFIGTSGSLRDRADFIASRTESSIPRARTYDYSELRVRVFGDVAVVTGREATTGEGVAFQGRFTHVWVEESGVWRLVAVQRTDIAASK